MQKKLIIVEDNFIIQMFLEEIISSMGHKVLASTDNGQHTLELIEKYAPDVLLLDIGLSGPLNGIELAGIIKDKYKIPFVFLTGNSDNETLAKAQSKEPLHIIKKPIDEDKLKVEFGVIVDKLERLKSTV